MENKSGFSFTEAQQRAIDARGRAVAVSAAAGSGKTRVLVQRVIEIMTGESPVPADRLLILTFANKAADEMKTRIRTALDGLIASDPSNTFYRRQQLMLDSADICTVHSFCGKVVRDNFFRLGISRDFRIGTENELRELKSRIMSGLIEEYYTPPEKCCESYEKRLEMYNAFKTLSLILSGPKLDSELEKELLKAYEKYTSHAFPEVWMEHCIKAYDPSLSLSENEGAKELGDLLQQSLPELRSIMAKADLLRADVEKKASAKKAPKTYEKALDVWDTLDMFLDEAEEYLSRSDLDALFKATAGIPKNLLSRARLKEEEHAELISAMQYLNAITDFINTELRPYSVFTEDVFHENNVTLYPVLCCLAELLSRFDKEFFAAKCEREMLDFDDLQRLMLSLLYERSDNGEYHTTPFAKSLSECYDEIMVDEYQDTNDVQESIFKAVSKNESNLFVVGDMKQSIYRFREAKPELFKRRCARAADSSDKSSELIILDRNFRSRSGVLDAVNFLFSLLMSEQAGEIDYDESQRLTYGASYPERNEEDTELHLIEYHKNETEDDYEDEDDSIEKTEAAYCAGMIQDMVASGTHCGDICILLRSVKNKAKTYANELERLGIPVYTDAGSDLLERYEIKAALSLLKIINNPLSDIDMAAALMCPVFGFSPDDMANLKLQNGSSYYKKLMYVSSKEDTLSVRCKGFLDTIRHFRTLSGSLPTDRLILRIFEETGFMCIMRAMPGGTLREENLRRLTEYAAGFEASSGGGLPSFVRHIAYLERAGEGIKTEDAAPPDAVRIMTIHHSKGLEFPVCILAGTNCRTKPNNDKVRYHSDAGIGLTSIDPELMIKSDTLQRAYIRRRCELEEKSEQLRILYVALTRAKEKLIILSTVKTESVSQEDNEELPKGNDSKLTEYLRRLASNISFDESTGRLSAQSVLRCTTISDLVVMCALMNESVTELRAQAALGEAGINIPSIPSGSAWKYVHIPQVQRRSASYRGKAGKINVSPELSELLTKKFADKPERPGTLVPSKVSASMLAHSASGERFTAVSKPDFARSSKVSATARGKATHKFLQYASVCALSDDSGSIETEKQRIAEEGIMSREQLELVSEKSVIDFTRSRIFERMKNAVRLYPEYRFTVNIPGELASAGGDHSGSPGASGCESVLQGAIDCIIEEDDRIVIVDYKTDRVEDVSELAETYGLQLRLYRAAAKQLFDKPVKECIIYSLFTGQEATVST